MASTGRISASMWTHSKVSVLFICLMSCADNLLGNEKDYIVVSLVRTKGLGFLDDFRRTNVMLTRCKKGMYICSSWGFVMQKAANTLVGMMAAKWGDDPEKLWFTPESLVTVDPVS